MLYILSFISCLERVEKEVETEPQSPFGALKIEEVYYSGAVPTRGLIATMPIDPFSFATPATSSHRWCRHWRHLWAGRGDQQWLDPIPLP